MLGNIGWTLNSPVKEIWFISLEALMGINPRTPLLANFLEFGKLWYVSKV